MDTNIIYNMDALTLLQQLPDASIDLILTDPPYACGSQVSARRLPDERFAEIDGMDSINHEWMSDAYRALKIGGAIYCFAKWVNMGEWKHLLECVGFEIKNCIVWDKMQHGLGDLVGGYAPQYEMILFGCKGRHLIYGTRPTDIIRIQKVTPQDLTHPYEKPNALLERLIANSTKANDIILDCFAGSGTTGIAARNLGRQYILGDTSAEYCALMEKRLALPYTPNMFSLLETREP